MVKTVNARVTIKTTPFTIRKLAKSGNSRYLSVGKILPMEWSAVKVYVIHMESGVCVLRLEEIK